MEQEEKGILKISSALKIISVLFFIFAFLSAYFFISFIFESNGLKGFGSLGVKGPFWFSLFIFVFIGIPLTILFYLTGKDLLKFKKWAKESAIIISSIGIVLLANGFTKFLLLDFILGFGILLFLFILIGLGFDKEIFNED